MDEECEMLMKTSPNSQELGKMSKSFDGQGSQNRLCWQFFSAKKKVF